MKKYDIAVIGGGFSGCAAAISAARQGKSVLLVEKSNALGGAANTCLVNPFMPYRAKIDGKSVDLCDGIFKEITDELEKMGGFFQKKTAKEANVFNEEYLKLILNRMVTQAGAELLFRSYLTEVHKDGEHITSVRVANKSGYVDSEADCFIDCTGDADLAYLAGCPFHLGREKDHLCQPMTLCFRMANVDIAKYEEEKPKINPLYKKFREEGKIKNIREDVLIFRNVVENVLHFNSTRIVKLDPTNAFDITKAEIEAREQVFELFDFLRENFEAFKNADILFTAPEIGVRESRMIDGKYVLTQDDLLACKKFDDSIACGNYDIDIHNPEGSGTSHYYFKEGEYYTIPYRCLLPQKADNLLVAGRCISATHEAQASFRIMPIVCCIGEAAGNAAAIALTDGTTLENADIGKLHAALKANHAMF